MPSIQKYIPKHLEGISGYTYTNKPCYYYINRHYTARMLHH